jgi:hypothetical protein
VATALNECIQILPPILAMHSFLFFFASPLGMFHLQNPTFCCFAYFEIFFLLYLVSRKRAMHSHLLKMYGKVKGSELSIIRNREVNNLPVLGKKYIFDSAFVFIQKVCQNYLSIEVKEKRLPKAIGGQ